MPEKIIGVLGGMGPEATVDFFNKVVSLTPANKDQEHLRIIIDNNPKIPDRTESILNKDNRIVDVLVATAKNLEKAGVDFIAIPCNTAHYFYDALVKEVKVPVLHMIREMAKAAKNTLPDCKKVGLLATTGTVSTNLYQQEFSKNGVEVITPTSEEQAKIMDAILVIKSGKDKDKAKELMIGIANILLNQRGAEAIILGCTDIPVVVKAEDFTVPVFDSNMILAKATVKLARS